MRTSICHGRVIGAVLCCTALVLAATGTAAAHPGPRTGTERQVLPAGDGWGSSSTGTTGGAAADAAHVRTVTTWDGFKAALAEGGSAPKIIKVLGTIDADGPDCASFAADGWDFDTYLATYAPEVWGRTRNLDDEPADSPEGLRRASAARQDASIKAFVPANTTIVGVGRDAGFKGASLQIKGVDNVIVRNLTFESPLDCFPQWDPTDTADGNWNSEYDSTVLYGATHVWMDHNTFTDGDHPDSTLPYYYGRIFEQHDGELDIVKGSDHVTASWNVFADHDKTILIGNSDSASTAAVDRGHLKVTLHHNLFSGLVERAPRVRFGQVDSYNNHFVAEEGYGYSYGIGLESRLVAEHNAFTLADGVRAGSILKKWSESSLTADDNWVNGVRTDLIAVHNAQIPAETLTAGAGWTPTLRPRVDRPQAVPHLVDRGAGAGHLG
ncbi:MULTISPECIES: polysaccharide lyase family 1 protein [Streptomyces]|uniref:Pectate lyase n=1 Tax=Streptomyces doudnae TaxID=3075536 RepID=A0ABD5ESW8_9ACTN|nr:MULTISPECIES: pectate lyase [unclassified Streptomyces]MDT0437736.1 pectate lyase [Streptomyces sp. DSM 41981]MYQ63424.1 pectate lyase [Streptomyces sp. SID4950]SCD57977.1 pectate lyase [Streptomyces sp. SolWspMP-5a-2]